MKFSSTLLALFFSSAILSPVFANDGGFDLGGMDPAAAQPKKLVVTHQMMADARAAAVKNSAELFRASDDPVAGNPKGDLTVVTFMDYHCPGSEIMTKNIEALTEKYPNLRIVFKEFPVHGEESIFGAKAALAAAKQGKYVAFHNALMAAGKYVTPDQMISIAKSLGLNVAQLKSDMKKPDIIEKIESTHKLGRRIGILGTPSTFFAQTDITSSATPDSVVFMMGKFPVKDLETAIGYATH